MRFNGRASMNVIEFASKPWRNGQMVVRYVVADVREAVKESRVT